MFTDSFSSLIFWCSILISFNGGWWPPLPIITAIYDQPHLISIPPPRQPYLNVDCIHCQKWTDEMEYIPNRKGRYFDPQNYDKLYWFKKKKKKGTRFKQFKIALKKNKITTFIQWCVCAWYHLFKKKFFSSFFYFWRVWSIYEVIFL